MLYGGARPYLLLDCRYILVSVSPYRNSIGGISNNLCVQGHCNSPPKQQKWHYIPILVTLFQHPRVKSLVYQIQTSGGNQDQQTYNTWFRSCFGVGQIKDNGRVAKVAGHQVRSISHLTFNIPMPVGTVSLCTRYLLVHG